MCGFSTVARENAEGTETFNLELSTSKCGVGVTRMGAGTGTGEGAGTGADTRGGTLSVSIDFNKSSALIVRVNGAEQLRPRSADQLK